MKPIIIVLLFLGAIGLGILGYRQDRKRRRLLRAWARSKGLEMHDGKQTGWEREYPSIKLFERGRDRHTKLHLAGEISGHRVRCLDYRYTTGSGKNRQTHRCGMMLVDAGHPLIPLRIRRHHVFDRVGEFFGHEDINFESAEFSRTFHVSSPDRKWAYDIIQPETMEYLLAAPPAVIEYGLMEIAVYSEAALKGAFCQDALKMARRLLALIPADVKAELQGGHR